MKNFLGEGNQNRVLKLISRLFLIKDSEFTLKLTYIMESWARNPDFGQTQVFAVREQLHRFRTKPTLDSDSSWPKVPPTIWNLVFFIACAPLPLFRKHNYKRFSR